MENVPTKTPITTAVKKKAKIYDYLHAPSVRSPYMVIPQGTGTGKLIPGQAFFFRYTVCAFPLNPR